MLAKVNENVLAELDSITAREMAQVNPDATKKFSSGLAVAMQIGNIRNLLTPEIMNQIVMPLKDCGSLGFMTDESQRSQPYTLDQIRNCATEALLRGAQLVGGEFMIFQGKTFFTKTFFERRVRTWPGISNLDIQCSTPRMMNGGAIVECTATFSLNGAPQKIERIGANGIAVRLQGNGGADAAIGKAEKRMYRFILNFIAGYAPPSDPDDDGDVTLKVVSEVKESPQIVEDSTPPQTPEKQPEPYTPAPSTSGNEAAKSAIKRTVKPKKNAEPTPLPEPTPAPEPEPKVEPEQEQPEQPEENLEGEELQEETQAVAEQEAAVKVDKFTVAKKDPDTQVPTLVRVITNSGEFFVKTKEDAASIGAITKANGGNVMIKYVMDGDSRMITAWAAPVKK